MTNSTPNGLNYTPTATRQGVKASAGSGKTYGLTGCYLQNLLSGTPPSSLITATFTRKAAGEILARLLNRLAAAAETENAAAALAKDLKLPSITRATVADSLQDLCRQMHRVSISTIDGLFNRLMQAFALELGHDFDVNIIDSGAPEATRLAHTAINGLLAGDVASEASTLLDVLQDSRLESRVASELHRVLPGLYREFVSVPPDAWILPEPVGELLSETQLKQVLVQLEQAASSEAKRTATCALELAKLARDGKWKNVLGNGIVKSIISGKFTYYNIALQETTISSVQPLISQASYCVVQRYSERSRAVLSLLQKFHLEFQVQQANERLLFFSDVPRLLSQLLPGDIASELEFRLDIVASHLLLDEFQDTDPVQYEILQWFIRKIVGRGESYGRLYCVGDLKQSIYGWRGAAPEIFEHLHRDIPNLIWQVTSTSYRSSQVVLDAVNRLYTHLPGSSLCERSKEVADWWKSNYEPHSAHRQLPGYVLIEQFAAEPVQPTNRDDDDGDGAAAGAVSETSVGAAARRIVEIVTSAPNASIGILMRTNERVAQMIFQLKELGVPASAEGKSLLTDDPAVLLLLSAVKLADHPDDSASAFHLLKSPLATTLGIEVYSRAYRASSELRKQFVCNGYASTLMKLAAKLASTVNRRSARRLEQFILLADEFDKSKRVRPAEFLELAETRQLEDPSSSQVRVMTIHAAKGLEFDIAVLPELEKAIESRADCVVERDIETMRVTAAMLYPDTVVRGICPQLQAIWEAQQNRDIREALCLLYVAMTRPRHALHILLPAKVSKFSLATFVIECLAPSAAPIDSNSTVTLYEEGDATWMRQLTTDTVPICEPASPSPYHVDVTGWPPHLLKSERPSAMRQYRATLADTLLGLDARAESLRQGVALHAMLCLVEWVDTAIPLTESVELAVRRAISDAQPAEMVQWYRRFQVALQFDSIKQLLSFPLHVHNEQVEVWRERQFLEMHEGRLLTGVFDRVVVRYRDGLPQCADVIDYKTDDLPNGAAKTRVVQRHTHQLEIYRTALSIMLGIPLPAVTAKLVFTETGEVVEV